MSVNPCMCGHEKGDHAMRIGQRRNYTPCNKCMTCSGFHVMTLYEASQRVVRAIRSGSSALPVAVDNLEAVLERTRAT